MPLPILVSRNGVVYEGHHRAAVAAQLGKSISAMIIEDEGKSRTNLPPHKLRVIEDTGL